MNDKRVSASDTIQVTRLYVVPHMRSSGISRRLIRKIIEEGNEVPLSKDERQISGVWLKTARFLAADRMKFRRCGFDYTSDESFLWYELKLADPREKDQRP